MGELRFTYVAIQKILATRPPYNCRLHYLPAKSRPHYFDNHRKLPVASVDEDGQETISKLTDEDILNFFQPTKFDASQRIPKLCTQRFCRRCQVYPAVYSSKDLPPIFRLNPLSDSQAETFKPMSPIRTRGSTPPGFDRQNLMKLVVPSFEPPSSNWVTISDSLDFLVIGNLSSVSSDSIFCPHAHFADGAIDICYARGCDRMDGINLMLDIESGIKIKAYFDNAR